MWSCVSAESINCGIFPLVSVSFAIAGISGMNTCCQSNGYMSTRSASHRCAMKEDGYWEETSRIFCSSNKSPRTERIVSTDKTSKSADRSTSDAPRSKLLGRGRASSEAAPSRPQPPMKSSAWCGASRRGSDHTDTHEEPIGTGTPWSACARARKITSELAPCVTAWCM